MTAPSFETVLAQAGVDVAGAKAALAEIDKKFGGEKGEIPDGALDRWVTAWFALDHFLAIGRSLGKQWEKEIVAAHPPERKWENDPKHATKADFLASQAAAKK